MRRAHGPIVVLAIGLALAGSGTAVGSSGEAIARAATTTPVPKPGWFRPPVFGGRAFPLARSNDLSLIEIELDWHAPRLRLVAGRWQLIGVHEGIDIYTERATPVVSMTPGHVENTGWTFYSGLRVGVRGTDGRYYFYAHLSAVAPGIAPGARVDAGTVLALAGNTGYGPSGTRDQFPPHLHFGIQVGPLWVDPYGTLVSLYDSTVHAEQRSQAALDRLATSGDPARWRRRAEQMFMHPDFGPRE
jgi:murein DD-endopeptidase MepM/ murein hydrolase activator NlpD